MHSFIDAIRQPWPWYVAGPLIGRIVPALLILGNKPFGISSSLRDICAACVPVNVPFFQYDWKKQAWNLFFVTGIFLGAMIAAQVLPAAEPVQLNEQLRVELATLGITRVDSLVPQQLFNWASLFTLKGFLLMVVGGFLVGFGTRYAGGCTSGHAIMGISNLQWPSVVATACFMAGGLVMANLLLPLILKL